MKHNSRMNVMSFLKRNCLFLKPILTTLSSKSEVAILRHDVILGNSERNKFMSNESWRRISCTAFIKSLLLLSVQSWSTEQYRKSCALAESCKALSLTFKLSSGSCSGASCGVSPSIGFVVMKCDWSNLSLFPTELTRQTCFDRRKEELDEKKQPLLER